jgi:hypothetical protein
VKGGEPLDILDSYRVQVFNQPENSGILIETSPGGGPQRDESV